MQLADRVALITGAGSGLGREIALTFARAGARIAVNDVRRESAERVAKEIEAAGSQALVLPADVSDSVEVRAIFEQLVEAWGTLDILVNNAGIAMISDTVKTNFGEMVATMLSGARPTRSIGATRTMLDSQWRRTLSVHLDGTFYCTREALKIMEPKGAGKIINMASIAGTTGLLGSPDYSAAKAGIIGLTKAVAREAISLRHLRECHRARLHRHPAARRPRRADAADDPAADSDRAPRDCRRRWPPSRCIWRATTRATRSGK